MTPVLHKKKRERSLQATASSLPDAEPRKNLAHEVLRRDFVGDRAQRIERFAQLEGEQVGTVNGFLCAGVQCGGSGTFGKPEDREWLNYERLARACWLVPSETVPNRERFMSKGKRLLLRSDR